MNIFNSKLVIFNKLRNYLLELFASNMYSANLKNMFIYMQDTKEFNSGSILNSLCWKVDLRDETSGGKGPKLKKKKKY